MKISEIRKGCGKEVCLDCNCSREKDSVYKDKSFYHEEYCSTGGLLNQVCGNSYGMSGDDFIYLCDNCQAKLTQAIEQTKDILNKMGDLEGSQAEVSWLELKNWLNLVFLK
jgi:hypothetical protein